MVSLMLTRFFSDYGMLLVLLLLCALLSAATIAEQHPSGAAAAEQLAGAIIAQTPAGAHVAIIARDGDDDRAFTATLQTQLTTANRKIVAQVNGQPHHGARALQDLAGAGVKIDVIAVTKEAGAWAIFDDFAQENPLSKDAQRLRPESYYWPNFLKASNLVNVADQTAIIAIMAIGMTMVILAGGIDLSVGSLLALSAVLSALLIREVGGGRDASPFVMIVFCVLAIFACALVGLGTGLLVTWFRVPAFIVTLGVMLQARGLAEKLTGGESVFGLPDAFTWLGRDSTLGFLPNSVVLMIVLYAIAHFVMAQTVLGRYIYAVGGNSEAARLSGVPVRRVIVGVYVVSALLAGVGGIIIASQLQTGAPTYGSMYELYVIAAVVVGGTSLSGGEGKILGTLIGAFLIAVIRNGMNLLDLKSWDQTIVLGSIIILAVLFDRAKHLGWLRWRSLQ
ncbi:MAG: ABC transporter permease [Gemmataceae bacterium]|nr:ABC transporter permease [Gemmataceae bacterium]